MYTSPPISPKQMAKIQPTDAAQLCQELAFPLTLTLSPGRGNIRLCRARSWRFRPLHHFFPHRFKFRPWIPLRIFFTLGDRETDLKQQPQILNRAG